MYAIESCCALHRSWSRVRKMTDSDSDVPVKEFWLIIHFKEGDPGKQFEILNQNELVGNSWDTLERGAYVTIMCGSCKSHGTVVHVSDDYEYLQTNFDSIKEEFLEEYGEKKDTKPPKKIIVPTKKKSPYYIAKPEIIKIADKETQTEPDELLEMKGKYEALKLKYDDLVGTMDAFRGDIKEALDKVDNRVNRKKRTYSTSTPSVSSRENSISPKGRKTTKNGKPVLGRNILNTIGNQLGEIIDQDDSGVVHIGSGRTKIPAAVFESINWHNYSSATRKLLMATFDRTTLATHSLTGKPSPAFLGTDKQAKMRLDPNKIADVVETVSKKCEVSQSLVRSAITTKCADENKMYRKRLEKGKENNNNGLKPKKMRYN